MRSSSSVAELLSQYNAVYRPAGGDAGPSGAARLAGASFSSLPNSSSMQQLLQCLRLLYSFGSPFNGIINKILV